jgi:hypothetical protein
MIMHPRLGVRQGLEDTATAPVRSLDDSPVHQKQQQPRSRRQRHNGPEERMRQIVFQVQAGVSNRFFKKGQLVLVITMQTVMCQTAVPSARELIQI